MRNRSGHKSPAIVIGAIAAATALIAGILFSYYQHASDEQRQQITTLGQAVQQLAQPAAAVSTPPPPAVPAVTASPTTTPQLTQEPAPAEPTTATSEPVPLTPTEAASVPATLEAGDASVNTELRNLLPAQWQTQVAQLLANEQLLRRFVSFVNNLATGKLDHENEPFKPIKGSFRTGSADSGALIIAPESYQRYNLYADIITALDVQRCAQLYRRYYPLLQSAQGELGLKTSFHNRMLTAIDMLLSTPDVGQPITLLPMEKRVYKMADPQLEGLPAAQKLLLRSGPQNAPRIKTWLQQLRSAIASTPSSPH